MRGNSFGKMFSITSFGESHGPGIGVVVDGVPAGLNFSLSALETALMRRAPGQVPGTTSRKETDQPEILSGVFEGKTLGTPIGVLVRNTNQRSQDYDKIKNEYRPGHADRTTMLKYGIRDHRGGGRASARETLARVVGGYFAGLVLPELKVSGFMSKMGPFEIDDWQKVDLKTDFGSYHFPDSTQWEAIQEYLKKLKGQGESVGGRVQVVIENCPIGLGEPVYDKLKSDLAKAMLSINACTSFSYGLGEEMAEKMGSEVSHDSSAFGGMEGGISNGDPIRLALSFKPTSTIGEKAKHGRHDPCVVPRAVPIVEAMAKIVIVDHYLRQNAYSFGD